jgi:hypothetical protein
LLELIPFASILFTFTNTGMSINFRLVALKTLRTLPVGAALWAADIEANNTMMTEMTTPRINEEASKKAE